MVVPQILTFAGKK